MYLWFAGFLYSTLLVLGVWTPVSASSPSTYFFLLTDYKLATGSRFEVHKRLVVSLLRFEYLDGLMCICCLRASCIPHSWSLTLGLLFRLPRLPLIFVSYWPTAFDHFARANHTPPRPPHPYHQPPRPSHP